MEKIKRGRGRPPRNPALITNNGDEGDHTVASREIEKPRDFAC